MLQETLTTQEQSVLNIFNRHVNAFYSGDIERVLEDYSPDSVILTQEGVFAGLDQIRIAMGVLLDEFGSIRDGDSPGFSFQIQYVKDDTLFITWHAESKKTIFPFGTDTFVCAGNKILRQSIAVSPPQPK